MRLSSGGVFQDVDCSTPFLFFVLFLSRFSSQVIFLCNAIKPPLLGLINSWAVIRDIQVNCVVGDIMSVCLWWREGKEILTSNKFILKAKHMPPRLDVTDGRLSATALCCEPRGQRPSMRHISLSRVNKWSTKMFLLYPSSVVPVDVMSLNSQCFIDADQMIWNQFIGHSVRRTRWWLYSRTDHGVQGELLLIQSGNASPYIVSAKFQPSCRRRAIIKTKTPAPVEDRGRKMHVWTV